MPAGWHNEGTRTSPVAAVDGEQHSQTVRLMKTECLGVSQLKSSPCYILATVVLFPAHFTLLISDHSLPLEHAVDGYNLPETCREKVGAEIEGS